MLVLASSTMESIERLLSHNRAFSPDGRAEDARPALRLAIVTCMDARLDLFSALGIALGQAHILRNAGGLVTDDMIRSLAISQRKLGTREVMVVQHTRCGMQMITDEEFAAELQRDAGEAPPFAAGAFTDIDASVRASVQALRDSPFLPHRDAIRGFVYDVGTHRLREVPATAP
jgi:carbonic anhydrase